MGNKRQKLSHREKDVMDVLWSSDEPLTASMITKNSNGLTLNTVATVIKKLLEKKYIEVGEIVYSGTVLTRTYNCLVSAEEYALEQLQSSKKSALKFSVLNFVDDFLKTNEDEEVLNELEELIRKKREGK